MKPRLILGIGNLLLRDEGVGVHVVRALERCDLPEDVELIDGGTTGADLIDDDHELTIRDRVDQVGSGRTSVDQLDVLWQVAALERPHDVHTDPLVPEEQVTDSEDEAGLHGV